MNILRKLFELSKAGQERGKNYLTLEKPKSLFLAFWCLMQMGKLVAAFLSYLQVMF